MTTRMSAFLPGILLLAVFFAPSARALDLDHREIAVFGAFDGPLHEGSFYRYGVTARAALPWRWTVFDRRLQTVASASVGGIHGDGADEGILSAGGGLDYTLTPSWKRPLRFRYELHGGLLTGHAFGRRNLGGTFQFVNHFMFVKPLTDRVSLAFGEVHISNADIYDSNPGIDTLTLELSTRY